MSHIPVGASCVRWGLPMVLDHTVGVGRGNRWLGRHCKDLLALLEKCGLEPMKHLFWSSRSAQVRAAKAEEMSEEGPALAPEDADREYSASTQALVLFLVSWPLSGFKCFDAGATLDDRSQVVLSLVLDKFVPKTADWAVSVPGSDATCGLELSFHGQAATLHGCGRVAETLRRLLGAAPSLVTALQLLCRIVRRPAQYPVLWPVAQGLFLHLLHKLGHSVEMSRDGSDWQKDSGLALVPSRRPGSKRCRLSAGLASCRLCHPCAIQSLRRFTLCGMRRRKHTHNICMVAVRQTTRYFTQKHDDEETCTRQSY